MNSFDLLFISLFDNIRPTRFSYFDSNVLSSRQIQSGSLAPLRTTVSSVNAIDDDKGPSS